MNDVLHFYISFIDKVMHGLNLVSLFLSFFLLSSVFLIMSCFVTCFFVHVFFNLIVNYYVKFKYDIVILV